MKILIQNYASALSTEPMYLNQCLNNAGAVSSTLWDTQSASAFDALDRVSPNLLLCHYNSPAMSDIVKYLSSNKNIDLALNITGASQKHVDMIQNMIDVNSISCPFFISNFHEKIFLPKAKTKILNLLPAADIFLSKQNVPDFNLEVGILSNSKESAERTKLDFKTYHKIGIGVNDDFFDFNVNVMNMASLYDKYDKIVISADMPVAFSQFFFDSVYRSKKVTLKTNDEKVCGEILGDLFESGEEDVDIASAVKEQVKRKHNCFKRASRLMSALNNDNAAKILNQLSEKV